MTIRRKLYFGFGAILAIMLALFVVNMFTVVREHAARSAAAATLSDVEIIENIRFQMMENRLFLENYLLSGDLRDEEKTNKGISTLVGLLKDGEGKGNDSNLRTSLAQVEENEHNWAENFAKQMIAKRHHHHQGRWANMGDVRAGFVFQEHLDRAQRDLVAPCRRTGASGFDEPLPGIRGWQHGGPYRVFGDHRYHSRRLALIARPAVLKARCLHLADKIRAD